MAKQPSWVRFLEIFPLLRRTYGPSNTNTLVNSCENVFRQNFPTIPQSAILQPSPGKRSKSELLPPESSRSNGFIGARTVTGGKFFNFPHKILIQRHYSKTNTHSHKPRSCRVVTKEDRRLLLPSPAPSPSELNSPERGPQLRSPSPLSPRRSPGVNPV